MKQTENRTMNQDFSETLRQSITNCGLSANALAEKTGVPQPTITRFLHGADMRLSTAERLAAILHLVMLKKK